MTVVRSSHSSVFCGSPLRRAVTAALVAGVVAVGAQTGPVSAQTRQAITPVAPAAGNFMWQTLQDAFLDGAGAACTVPISVAVSDHATCYADPSGQLRCEGDIYSNTYTFDTPVGPTGVDQIMLSPTFNANDGNAVCVHQTDGTVSCMGSPEMNHWGQFGTGATSGSTQFVPWGGGRTDLARVGTGTWDQMCVLTNAGDVQCSGYSFGLTPQLVGSGSKFYVSTYGTAEIASTVDRVSPGRSECTVENGALNCVGRTFGTNVVDGGFRSSAYPNEEVCALDNSGAVTCQLTDRSQNTTSEYGLFNGGVLALATNYYTARVCAVKIDGSLWCADGAAGSEIQMRPAGSIATSCGGVTGGDTTAPVVRPMVSGVQGRGGWYTSDVQVSWAVADRESRVVAQSGCASSYVSGDTTGMVFTCAATSAGGTTVETLTIKRDATPPVAATTALPAANQNGWRRQAVTATHTAVDTLASPLTCDPAVRLARDGMQQAATGLCRDAAGNVATSTSEFVNIDRTVPLVAIASPVAGTYAKHALVAADYSCTDALSGIVSCEGTLPYGSTIDTSAAVNGRFVVTATDAAGNTARRVVTYKVR